MYDNDYFEEHNIDKEKIEKECLDIWNEICEKYHDKNITPNGLKVKTIKEIINLDEEDEIKIFIMFNFADKVIDSLRQKNLESELMFK